MKRVSDGQLLAAVLGVPVGALLLLSGISALFGETNTSATIAIGCTMVLMLSSLLPQMAGVRFATNGPRSLQNRLGFWGAFFAMMLLGQMPNADQPLARAALGWLLLGLVIALIGGKDAARHIKSLRPHPRALRKVWRDMMFGVAFGLILCASNALAKGASPAQALWAGLVFCGAILTAPQVSFARALPMPNRRLAILSLAYGIYFSALMVIFAFVVNLGQKEGGEVMAMLIGGVLGSFVYISIIVARQIAKRG